MSTNKLKEIEEFCVNEIRYSRNFITQRLYDRDFIEDDFVNDVFSLDCDNNDVANLESIDMEHHNFEIGLITAYSNILRELKKKEL